MGTDSQELGSFAARVCVADAPAVVRDKLKATLLHNLGMLRAGRELAPFGVAVATDHSGREGATVFRDGSLAHRDRAVLANAAMIHARTQDDTHLPAITHLAATCLAPLIATAEDVGASGAAFLDAMLASYEVGAAAAVDVGPLSSARGFRPSSVLGGVAASAGVARLRGADATQISSAIGLAASFGGGTGQTWVAGTDEWQYQVGVAGRNGMLAAELAMVGATAAPDALEGVAGLYQAFAGNRHPHRAPLSLGEHWRTLEVTYKPFPICAINQMPATVLIEMARALGFDASDVQTMELRLSPAEAAYPGTDTHGPFTGISGALMSAPYCMAITVRELNVTRQMVEDFENPEVNELADRISVVSDPELQPGECVINVRSAERVFRSDEIERPAAFDWEFEEVRERLLAMEDERGMSRESLSDLVECLQDLENRSTEDLVGCLLRD